MRIEKFGDVIAGAVAAATAEIAVRFDAGVATARHVIRDKIDDRLEIVRVQPFEQLSKFLQPIGWFLRVIRADVEIILDRVRTAGESL